MRCFSSLQAPPAYKNHRTFLKACELLKKRGCTDWEAVWTLNGDENDGIRALKKEAEEKDTADPIRGNDVKGRLVCTVCQIGTGISVLY